MRALPLILLLSVPGLAAAQGSDRAGVWEAGFRVTDNSSEFVQGENGASIDVDSELAWGGVVQYNINNHFAVSGEFAWSDPNYSARFPLDRPGGGTVNVDAELDILDTHFKAIWNFFDRVVTPYAEIGYGWTVVDSNIQDGAADTGCWWDPWWGYMCASFYDTYESTLTSMSYGLGVRWDMGDAMVLKGSYNIRELDLDRAEDLEQDLISVEFAWKF